MKSIYIYIYDITIIYYVMYDIIDDENTSRAYELKRPWRDCRHVQEIRWMCVYIISC